jgi:plasmid stabilization system protein ParE
MRYRFAKRATDDLIRIALELSDLDANAALRWIQSIEEAVERLTAFPGIGHRHRQIADPTVRVWPVSRWLVVYRVTDEIVHVMRVAYGMSDLTNVDID